MGGHIAANLRAYRIGLRWAEDQFGDLAVNLPPGVQTGP
jgi:hypothetical protein